jgi:hypothetical protein
MTTFYGDFMTYRVVVAEAYLMPARKRKAILSEPFAFQRQIFIFDSPLARKLFIRKR